MKPVTKAVFPVAGLGSRFLPATKASPKEMLPIVDKPLIQFAVEEAAAAGITDMIFITGRSKRAIEDHFDKAYELETELALRNKTALLETVQSATPAGVNCIYIRQTEALGLGHAVLCAEPVIGDEPFAVLLADDLIDADVPVMKQMADLAARETRERDRRDDRAAPRTPAATASSRPDAWPGAARRSPHRREAEARHDRLAPGGGRPLRAVGAHLPPPAHDAAGRRRRDPADRRASRGSSTRSRCSPTRSTGRRYDCGTKLGYLEATVDHGLKHPEVGAAARALARCGTAMSPAGSGDRRRRRDPERAALHRRGRPGAELRARRGALLRQPAGALGRDPEAGGGTRHADLRARQVGGHR